MMQYKKCSETKFLMADYFENLKSWSCLRDMAVRRYSGNALQSFCYSIVFGRGLRVSVCLRVRVRVCVCVCGVGVCPSIQEW